jgi:hypothetical protein
MPEGEVDNDDIIDRLTRIFKDMPPYTACPPGVLRRTPAKGGK